MFIEGHSIIKRTRYRKSIPYYRGPLQQWRSSFHRRSKMWRGFLGVAETQRWRQSSWWRWQQSRRLAWQLRSYWRLWCSGQTWAHRLLGEQTWASQDAAPWGGVVRKGVVNGCCTWTETVKNKKNASIDIELGRVQGYRSMQRMEIKTSETLTKPKEPSLVVTIFDYLFICKTLYVKRYVLTVLRTLCRVVMMSQTSVYSQTGNRNTQQSWLSTSNSLKWWIRVSRMHCIHGETIDIC